MKIDENAENGQHGFRILYILEWLMTIRKINKSKMEAFLEAAPQAI